MGEACLPCFHKEVSLIKYYGKITDPKDLATKEYVDSSSHINELPAGDALDELDEIPFYDKSTSTQKKIEVGDIVAEVSGLSIDSTPTLNSSNLITSGGVYEEIMRVYEYIASLDRNETAY